MIYFLSIIVDYVQYNKLGGDFMKKLFILLPLLLSLFLNSCEKTDYDILPFEGKNVYAECEINDKFTVTIEKVDSERRLTVISPSEISGLEFTFSESEDFVMSGDIKIPADRNLLSGIYALSSLFNIEEEMMTSAISKDGYGNIEFQCEAGFYTFVFDTKGYMTGAEISGEGFSYNVRILSMKIE